MKYTHELVICIVNSGFSEAVMNAAKSIGARGGTVIYARGTAEKEAESLFGITIQPEKELVMILVRADLRDALMQALYHHVGLNTPGQGIAFALPVDHVVGLNEETPVKTEEK